MPMSHPNISATSLVSISLGIGAGVEGGLANGRHFWGSFSGSLCIVHT